MVKANGWVVTGNSIPIPFWLAPLYGEANRRVMRSPRMSEYRDLIMSDAYADDEEHLRWVIKAKVSDIVSWAMDARAQED